MVRFIACEVEYFGMYKCSLCIEFRLACVCMLVLEFRFVELPGELGAVVGISIHDWEFRDDEMILLIVFILDDS